MIDMRIVAAGGLTEVAPFGVIPALVVGVLLLLLSVLVSGRTKRSLIICGGAAVVLAVIAFAVYLPNSA